MFKEIIEYIPRGYVDIPLYEIDYIIYNTLLGSKFSDVLSVCLEIVKYLLVYNSL